MQGEADGQEKSSADRPKIVTTSVAQTRGFPDIEDGFRVQGLGLRAVMDVLFQQCRECYATWDQKAQPNSKKSSCND